MSAELLMAIAMLCQTDVLATKQKCQQELTICAVTKNTSPDQTLNWIDIVNCIKEK